MRKKYNLNLPLRENYPCNSITLRVITKISNFVLSEAGFKYNDIRNTRLTDMCMISHQQSRYVCRFQKFQVLKGVFAGKNEKEIGGPRKVLLLVSFISL